MRAAVVGHVEWIHFVRVDHVPAPGEIVHAQEWWEEPGGGGAGAAVQLAKLADDAIFFTALGDDELGHRAYEHLTQLGLRVEASFRPMATRRGVTHVDATGERTITVLGERLAPNGSDPLPWDELEDVDALYFTAGDVAALRFGRKARVVVATSRTLDVLKQADVELDALVGSALDTSETYRDDDVIPTPRLMVRTEGGEGGTFTLPGAAPERYPPATLTGAIVDKYGAGDSFAGSLAYALALDLPPVDALALASRCGAAVLTGRGPYAGQLTRDRL